MNPGGRLTRHTPLKATTGLFEVDPSPGESSTSNALASLEEAVEKKLTEPPMQDWETLSRADGIVREVTERGDSLWRAGDADQESVLDALASGIAILARRRNGVTVNGRHWCLSPHTDCPGEGAFTDQLAGAGKGVVYTPRWLAHDVTETCLLAMMNKPGPLHSAKSDEWQLRPIHEVARKTVIDIACGSGVFLVVAAQIMASVLADVLEPVLGGYLAIHTARQAVLQRCIYGVDIEPWAVEITRICLKLLEPLAHGLDVFIDRNIVCGDSLAGPSFTDDPDMATGFPGINFPKKFREVHANGGFDAVIGNPPFLGGQKISGQLGKDYREHLCTHVANGVKGSADLAAYFALRSRSLVKPVNGHLALITTNTLAQGATRRVGLEQIATGDTCIWGAIKSAPWPTAKASLEYCVVWIVTGGECAMGYTPTPPVEVRDIVLGEAS